MTDNDRRRHSISNRMRRKVLRGRARSDRPVRRVDLDRDIVIAAMMVLIVLIGLLASVTLYQQHLIKASQVDITDSQDAITASQIKIQRNQNNIRRQQKTLAKLEVRDRLNSYQTAYRFCSRINIDRAAIHALVDRSIKQTPPGRERRFAMRYKSKIEAKSGMPILDCRPNITGGPAAYWPPRKQRSFVRRWDTEKLTPAEIGICRIRIGKSTKPGSCLKP